MGRKSGSSTDVTVGGTALIMESIIGGGEFGRVLGNTLVKIQGGQIGIGEGKIDGNNQPIRYTDDQFVDPLNTTITAGNALKECSHFPYGRTEGGKKVYLPYDPYHDEYPAYIAAHPVICPIRRETVPATTGAVRLVWWKVIPKCVSPAVIF